MMAKYRKYSKEFQLQAAKLVVEQGRIPIVWDDMLLGYAGVYKATKDNEATVEQVAKLWGKGRPKLNSIIKEFPKNCVYMRWNYTLARQPGNIMALDWYQDNGLKSMVTTAAQNTSPLMPRDDRVDVTKSFTELGAERGISGVLSTAWDDASPHMETYWRGFIALAEYSWAPGKRSQSQYEVAYLQRFLGPECVKATELYKQLFQISAFYTTFWRLKPEEIGLPDSQNSGAWSRKHKEWLDGARRSVKLYEQTSKQLAGLSKKARRNRYHLEVLTAVNDFQITPANLLLALEQCDTEDLSERCTALKAVQAALDKHEIIWKELKKVYARRRFISYPDNYVKDRYFHYTSTREDLSFMILGQEAYHPMVRIWINNQDH